MVSRPRDQYQYRSERFRPDWPEGTPLTYRFNASDGGVFDNEPIGIVRKSMARSAGHGELQVSASNTWGAIILIDAFASGARRVVPDENVEPLSFLQNIRRLGLSLRSEAMFKNEELSAALNEKDFSTFLISPVRENRGKDQPILATSTMEAFGGMLHRKIRHHDFLLGRRNCQKFLQEHFCIPAPELAKNRLFNAEAYLQSRQGSVQIIPLVGTALEECPAPEWPKFSPNEKRELEKSFRQSAENRIKTVTTTMARNAGILKPTAWYRFISKAWQMVMESVIRILSDRLYDRLDPVVKKALDVYK